MEQSIIKLIDDVHEIEDAIALKIKEGTFSEKIMPSTPIEDMVKEIKEDPETRAKYIEVGEGEDMYIVPLCLITTPRFSIGIGDIDPGKDMKTQIIDEASAICELWDSQLLEMADAAVNATGNVITRGEKVMSRENFVDLFNLIEVSDIKAEMALMRKDVFNLVTSYMNTEVEGSWDISKHDGKNLGRQMIVTIKEKIQDNVYAFGASHFIGSSFMGAPELKIMIHKMGITWEVRVLTARVIGNVNAVAKSCVDRI